MLTESSRGCVWRRRPRYCGAVNYLLAINSEQALGSGTSLLNPVGTPPASSRVSVSEVPSVLRWNPTAGRRQHAVSQGS